MSNVNPVTYLIYGCQRFSIVSIVNRWGISRHTSLHWISLVIRGRTFKTSAIPRGGGVKNWTKNADITMLKLPTWGGRGQKVGKNCRRLLCTDPYRRTPCTSLHQLSYQSMVTKESLVSIIQFHPSQQYFKKGWIFLTPIWLQSQSR